MTTATAPTTNRPKVHVGAELTVEFAGAFAGDYEGGDTARVRVTYVWDDGDFDVVGLDDPALDWTVGVSEVQRGWIVLR